MKTFIWLCTGIGIGVAAAVLLNQPQSQFAPTSGSSDLDDAATNAGAWGTKQRIGGTGENLLGKAKKGVGQAIGNDKLAGEGLVDQAAGAVKDTAGKAANAVSDTLREINR